MEIITEILGNVYRSHDWRRKLQGVDVYYACLDQWTAQKSRFLVVTDDGTEYPVALRRPAVVRDGDILYYAPHEHRAVVVKLSLCEVMVIDLSALLPQSPITLLRTAVEVGHALGNQHWPAVVKGTRVFVPLAVDKQVMRSVMETHRFEGVTTHFYHGHEVIPYLAPHELRRLFGGTTEGKDAPDCGCTKDAPDCGCGAEDCACPPKKECTCGRPDGKCTCGAEDCDCEEDKSCECETGKPVNRSQCLCKVYEFHGFYTKDE